MNNKIWLILAIISYVFVLTQPAALFAQGADPIQEEDFFAPFIDHSALDESLTEKQSVDIQATITDNLTVQSAVLFYRSLEGSQKKERFTELNMALSEGDIYAVTIPGKYVVGSALEYYIQASDTSGNTAYRGNESAPLTVSIGAGKTASEEAALFSTREETASDGVYKADKPWHKKWWIWAIGGAVLVGAAAGGGGGGGNASAGTGNNPGSLNVSW